MDERAGFEKPLSQLRQALRNRVDVEGSNIAFEFRYGAIFSKNLLRARFSSIRLSSRR
jgi:hypothetical protein